MLSLKIFQNQNRNDYSNRGIFVATLAIATVFGLNFMLKQIFSEYIPMCLFLSSIVITAWVAGARAGIIATFFGAIIELLFFSNSAKGFLTSNSEVVGLSVYFIQGFGVSIVFGDFHKSQRQVIDSEKQLLTVLECEKIARANAETILQKLKKSQKQLSKEREIAKNANRVKTLFLAHMSHEIRTPLAAVLGFTDLLKDPALSQAERLNYIDIIERTGNNLKDIINDILDISKVEAGHFEMDLIPFSLQTLIQEVHSVLKLKCHEKNIDLLFEPDGEIPRYVKTDPKRLRQILVNLIGNSIKFTDKGFVKMIYKVEASSLCFRVYDTGLGISGKQKSRLFENFSQGDSSVSRRFAGTGLGLALSRKLARMLGGDIKLISSEINEGSVFEIKLNFEPASEVTVWPKKYSFEEDVPDFEGKKILVVDDSADNRLLLECALKKIGCQVFTAADGAEALTKTETQYFDLILMDMQMPVMDGYVAAQHLRSRECKTPVIALTANALKEDRLKCIEAGCDDYLSKPLQKEELYEIIRTHC